MQEARDVKIIETAMHQILDILVHNKNPVHGSRAVPVGATFTVGMEMPLRELKTKLLKDETVTMLVLTAAGGCGKTTLAIKFCEDDEVKGRLSVSLCSPLFDEVLIHANKLLILVVI